MDSRGLMGMQICQCIQELIGPEEDPAQRERLLRTFQPLCKIVSCNVLHDKVLLTVLRKMVTNLWQHGMSRPCERPGFPFEGTAEHFVVGKECSLQGYRASQTLIDGKINLTHSTFSDEMDDEVTVLY